MSKFIIFGIVVLLITGLLIFKVIKATEELDRILGEKKE